MTHCTLESVLSALDAHLRNPLPQPTKPSAGCGCGCGK